MSEVIDYTQSVNLAGVAPADVTQQDPPGGPWEVEILGSRQVTSEGERGSGKTSLRYSVSVVEDGPAKGITTQVVIGTDWAKGFNVAHLKNLYLGLHKADGKFVDASKIEGVVTVKPAMFAGMRAYIFVKEPAAGEVDDETGRVRRADKNFITKDMYEAQKRARTAAGAKAAAAPPAGKQPAAAPATGTPQSLDALFG